MNLDAKGEPHGEPKHLLYLLLKAFALSTTAVLVHPISYPVSAATLLAQVSVIPDGMEVSKIVRYAFSRFRLGDVLRQGGSVVSLLQSFTQLGSVAVEDMWMSLFSPTNEHIDTLRVIAKTIGVIFNIALNCPLDVLRTRLLITDLYNPNRSRVVPFTPISAKKSITTTCKKMLNEEGWASFYSGWEITIIDAVVDHVLGVWERAELAPGRAIFSLIPAVLRAFCRYAFLVMKAKANIRNDGFWNILMDIYSTKGLYGFFVGWRLFMLKIPVYIFNLVLANVLFMQLKTFFNPKTLPGIDDDIPNDKKPPRHLRRQNSNITQPHINNLHYSDNGIHPDINHNINNHNHNHNHNHNITHNHIQEEDEYIHTDEEGDPPTPPPSDGGPPNGGGDPRKRDGWYRVNSATF